jgi:hypothetical protein
MSPSASYLSGQANITAAKNQMNEAVKAKE